MLEMSASFSLYGENLTLPLSTCLIPNFNLFIIPIILYFCFMKYCPVAVVINRDALQKFFFPFDYQEIQSTKPLVPGQKRVHTGMDVKFSFDCDATLDILFSKNRVGFFCK